MINKLKIFAFPIIVAVIASFFLTMMTLRICASSSSKIFLSIPYLICGQNLSNSRTNFKKLQPGEIFATSNIQESAGGRDASKLVDGSIGTLAEPGATKVDYKLNFLDNYEVKQVIIHWGDYGINDNYIKSWILESSLDDISWQTIVTGERPLDLSTVVNKRFSAKSLRLRAESAKDWIGVYEVEVVGRVL